MNRKTSTKKRNYELYWYFALVGYIILAIILSGLYAASKGLSPQVAAKIAANYTALAFVVWIALTAYYLLRWTAHKLGLQRQTLNGRLYQKWKDEHQDELSTVEAHNYELWLKSKK